MRYQEIFEISALAHTEKDDAQLAPDIQKQYEASLWKLKPFGEFAGIRVMSTTNPDLFWADGYRSYFYLVKDDKLIGQSLVTSFNRPFGRTHCIRFVYIYPDDRKTGLGLAFYTFLLNKGAILESDSAQTPLSKSVWRRLAAMPEYDVRVMDDEGKIVSDDVNLAYTHPTMKLVCRSIAIHESHEAEQPAVPTVLRTIPADEANRMLHDAFYGGKNKDQKPVPFHREKEEFVLVDLPLSWIQPNDEGDLYDATTHRDRMLSYSKLQIKTPVFITYGKYGERHGLLGYVADGGHRVSAARLRGDVTIRALMRKTDFTRLVARQRPENLQEGLLHVVIKNALVSVRGSGTHELPVLKNPTKKQVMQ